MTLRVIQIGSGGWGSSWLEFVHNTEECELVGLVSRGGANLGQAKARWQIEDSRCYTNIDKALSVDADLVIITVPHHRHVELATRVVRAGKNVLIEKPLSDSFGRAKEFALFMENREEKAWVSQNFRFRRELWQIRASLNDQGAGKPLWLEICFRMGTNSKVLPDWRRYTWRRAQWSFLMSEILIHHCDMLRFLLNADPVTVMCRGWNPTWRTSAGPEVLFGWFEFGGGAQVAYTGTTESLGLQTGWQANWLIQTDRGSIRWEGDTVDLQAENNEEPVLVEPLGFPGFDRHGVLREVMHGLRGEKCTVPSVADNLRSMAFVAAAELSVREGREVQLAEIVSRRRISP